MGGLDPEELKQLLPAETSAFPSPIPTQSVSSDEFMPAQQTAKQREFEAPVKEDGAALGRRQGMSRRAFFTTAAGMAAAFVAMNDTDSRLYMVSRTEAGTPEMANERAKGLADQFIMDMHTHLREVVFENLRSGLSTDNMLESDPTAMRVSWIAWDSGFRGSELRVGDQIIAVDGEAITRPTELRELQRLNRELPGGLNEGNVFAAKGWKDGSPLTLTIRRRRYPGEGWLTQDVTGKILAERMYSYPNGRRGMGPTGPDSIANDGFDSPWASWYEKRVFDWKRVLDGGWQTKLNTRVMLKSHLEEKPRVDFLSEKYPGLFSDAVRADWETVRTCLEGTRYLLPPEALDFRQLEEERAKQVASAAAVGWKGFLAQRAADLVGASVSIDPIRGDRSQVSGKLVALPPIAPSQWVVSINRNFLSSEQNGVWYFVPTDSPGMQRSFVALQRYKRYVSPKIRDEFAVIGRILPDPRMMIVRGRGVAGFELEPIGVLAGNAMFVDLTVVRDDVSPFAGEDQLHKQSAALPPDDATPRQVLEALIAALKAGDQGLWNQLFADWRLIPDEQKPIYYPFYPYPVGSRDEDWIRSRRLVLEKIFDVRVIWVGDPRLLQAGNEYQGAPRIEQVSAELEHIGFFDKEYRAFNGLEVNRQWTLQRRTGGPWRISSQHGI
jgi:hypothetical protein